jgi:L-threonylcarbamoyladenylate synthase
MSAPGREIAAAEAVARVAAGGLVVYPTETAWGLGADASSEAALRALGAFKGRDAAKPVSVLVEGPEALERLGAGLSAEARALVRAFWPGPLTLVVRLGARLAPGVAGAGGGVGLRCSPHPVAREIARLAAKEGVGPITATSLNRSGAPAARTRAEAARCCAGGGDVAPLLVAGEDAGGAPESSVVDLTGPAPRLLREGALSAAEITRALERSASR